MKQSSVRGRCFRAWPAVALVLVLTMWAGYAQERPTFALGDGPWTFDTLEPPARIRVSVITKGLSHPWGLAFLPNGDMLVTERAGSLRVIRAGVLDRQPIAGVPQVLEASSGGLMDIALHPEFATNRFVYFVYVKPGKSDDSSEEYFATTALARGRFNGAALTEVRDVFVADAWSPAPGGHGSRIIFEPDGTLYLTLPHRREPDRAQDPSDHVGTIVRVRDDGEVPHDNPFVGRAGYEPEIYSYGHRVPEGLAFHPETGQLWATEHGPQGGDELNIILPGRNYGWPVVTYGRRYDGSVISERPWREGMEQPELFWVPSIAPSGMTFYTGDRFSEWKGNLFVGAMEVAGMPGTGHLERLVFNDNGEQRREWLLSELKQRIRDVRQGPDGLLYVLTEEAEAALLRIEPAE